MKVQISVIVPTYNRASVLVRALESVRTQRFSDYEVIVVDDGSTDGTLELLKGWSAWVKVLARANRGPGAARNAGAMEAKGEYLAFLDSDDLWFPWTLACFAELIREHEQPAILGAKLVLFSHEAELAVVTETPVQAEVFDDYFASHGAGWSVGAGMSVLRRDEFLKTGGYTDKPINAEDHDLILRMGDTRGFVQITSPVTLGWRRHAGNVTLDLARGVAGKRYLVEQEQRGAYPGGHVRQQERREIVTRHARPDSVACLRNGLVTEGWRLYWATFGWHLRLGRWKYLAGFPALAAAAAFRRHGTTV